MSDVTQILNAIQDGDPSAAKALLPLIYDELRKLAAAKMAQGKPGQTLQATALLHEAYLRLVDSDRDQHWNSRGHFFGAAAEAMRRILIQNARHRRAGKRGGDLKRLELNADLAVFAGPSEKCPRLVQWPARSSAVSDSEGCCGTTTATRPERLQTAFSAFSRERCALTWNLELFHVAIDQILSSLRSKVRLSMSLAIH